MRMTIARRGGIFAAVAAAAGLTAACMTNAGPPRSGAMADGARQCFLPSQVNGFHALDRDTVHVMVGANDVYQLELFGNCPEVDWSQRVGIRSTGGGSWVCNGLDAELVVPSPLGLQQCQVTSIQQLTEEQARAIRAAHGD